MTSLVLGIIGLMLFFLPVLGIPISAIGLALGLIGLLRAFAHIGSSLRWSISGTGLCALALLVNFAINYAPWGYIPSRQVPPSWNPPHGRSYVPPPAEPGQF
jgi:hypothetical protein